MADSDGHSLWLSVGSSGVGCCGGGRSLGDSNLAGKIGGLVPPILLPQALSVAGDPYGYNV